MKHSSANGVRSPLTVTFSVWKALFLREAVHRLFNRRYAAFWLLLEPVVSIVFFVLIFTVIRIRVINGIDTAIWISAGLLSFMVFKKVAMQSMNAVNANKTLFAYRQVKPVDTVLMRGAVEGFIVVLVGVTLFSAAGVFGYEIIPDDALFVISSIIGLSLFALGFGLTVSVLIELVPEISSVVQIVMMPLGLISGTIFPIAMVPQAYREWLMLNPVAHGLEGVRHGFSAYYHEIPELDINYLYGSALVSIFLGFLLHKRFQNRLITQ